MGRELKLEEITRHLPDQTEFMSQKGQAIIQQVTEALGLRLTDREITQYYQQYAKRRLELSKGLPPPVLVDGLKEFATGLRKRGVKISVVTGSGQGEFDLQRAEVYDLVDTIHENVSEKYFKIQEILGKAGISGDQAVYFGDNPQELKDAKQLGLMTVAVVCSYLTWGNRMQVNPAKFNELLKYADYVIIDYESPVYRVLPSSRDINRFVREPAVKGLPIQSIGQADLEYKPGTNFSRSARKVSDMADVLVGLSVINAARSDNRVAYYMDRGLMEKDGLRYDVTFMMPGQVTMGHYHVDKGPELYEVIDGKGFFFLQKVNEQGEIVDVMVMGREADAKGQLQPFQAGDKVNVMPGYGHVWVNVGDAALVLGNWANVKSTNDYATWEKTGGHALSLSWD